MSDSNGTQVALATVTAPTGAEMAAEFMPGFDGASIAPFDAKIVAILNEPIDPEMVEIKPDGIVYLPGSEYRARLFRAFGPGGWALVKRGPIKSRQQGAGTVVMFEGALYAQGRFVAEAAGHCTYFSNNRGINYVDAIEGAKTDCLTKCCKDIMPAVLVMWDPGWRDEWQRKYAETYRDKEGNTRWRRKGRTQRMQTPAPAAAAASASTKTSADDGEAVTEEQLDELEDLVFKKMAWLKPFAASWLKERFGFSDPAALTREQLRTAYELLYAFGPPPDAPSPRYKPLLEKLRAEGRCK